jgi:hypothetical protein
MNIEVTMDFIFVVIFTAKITPDNGVAFANDLSGQNSAANVAALRTDVNWNTVIWKL